MNVCLILSGSIAAYKGCELASLLVKAGHEVQTVASEGALRFVGAASLEGLTDKKVYTDLWAPRESKTHISLRRWADLFVFYPATANRINQMAAGLAPDLIGATFLANNFEKPFWIAPAMNTNMLRHPATQAALRTLESWGCRILRSDDGRLACGDVGEGRLADPKAVFGLIQALAGQADARGQAAGDGSGSGRRVLITGGAMTEAVDGVRSITNSSSGRTAARLARSFLEGAWQVDFLHHQSADLSILGVAGDWPGLRLREYRGFADFEQALFSELGTKTYQAVVHAAAVSDYHVARVINKEGRNDTSDPDVAPWPSGSRSAGKLAPGVPAHPAKLESGQPLLVELQPNPKLLPQIRSRATGAPVIVGFKLTVGESQSAGEVRARGFIEAGHCDLVVWNDMGQLPAGTEAAHPFTLFGAQGVVAQGNDNNELAVAVVAAVNGSGGTQRD